MYSNEVQNQHSPIRPGLFSWSPGLGGGGRGGGGGSVAQMPIKVNQGNHQPIEMKICMSHYSHESMPNAKFESSSVSIVGDMTSESFPLKRGTSHQIQIFTSGKGV